MAVSASDLAIARVLAYDPHVVLYDEPTSGLDSATAAEVTHVIEQTYANHPCTLLIVTHDYEALSRIADAIYLIDPEQCALRLIDKPQWPRLSEILQQSGSSRDELISVPGTRLPIPLQRLSHGTSRFLADTSRFVESCLQLPWRLLPVWKSPWWGCRFLLHYLRSVASPSAWLYIAIAGAIIGFVSTYFTFRFLPNANYTKPLLIEDLLRSMGFALYRILVPILVTILIAARCGAAVASDVGGKRYGRQMDALKTLGVEPRRYLLTGILYAFLVGTPWLLAIGYAAAAVTSLVVFTATHPHRGPWFWQLYFHRELIVPGQLVVRRNLLAVGQDDRLCCRDCRDCLRARSGPEGLQPGGQPRSDVDDSVGHALRAVCSFRVCVSRIQVAATLALTRLRGPWTLPLRHGN